MSTGMLPEEEAGALGGVYRDIRRRLGLSSVPNVFKAMAAVNGDVLIQNWTAFRYTLLQGLLPRQLKEMIGVVVSRRAGSDCAIRMHTHNLRALGVQDRMIASLVAQGDCEELEANVRAILRFAVQYSQDGDTVSSAPMDALGLSEDEIQEIVDTVVMVEGLSRFSIEAGIPADG